MATVKELAQKITAKNEALHQVFVQAGEDLDFAKVTTLEGDTKAKQEKVAAMNKELADLQDELQKAQAIEGVRERVLKQYEADHNVVNPITHPAPGNGNPPEAKSLGKMFVESAAFKGFSGRQGPEAKLDIDLKTLMYTGSGWATESMRLPRVVLSAQRPIGVVDFFPQYPTSQAAIKYMEETTFTNNAAEKAEQSGVADANVIGESALVLTERTQTVEWLPVFIPVTQQQMEDVEGMEAYVNQRLVYMLQARIDLQAIQGDGNTPNLLGTNTKVSTNVQAKGADPTPDAIFKAITLVRATGYAEPSVIFMHPNDWQDVRLLRTADGIYIFGNPSDPGVDRLWGIQVHVTAAALQNTATLGDYRNYAGIFNKRGITLAVSDSHAYYFTRGTLAIRADTRLAVVHFRETAFARVTGI